MRILVLLILSLIFFFSKQVTDSPHGKEFKVSCGTCHSSKGWLIDKDIYSFNHNNTAFALTGQHNFVNCRQCHKTLVFKEAKSECVGCHNDLHQATVGSDCSRCHTPSSWLVSNVTEIHQRSRFPLTGAHRSADCIQCHKSETLVRFDVPGVRCIDCHRDKYIATAAPNHIESGFSEDCAFCHPVNSQEWRGAGFNHNFFPLSSGHSAVKCTECHKTSTYSDATPDCIACHEKDFLSAINPNHQSLKFSTSCSTCHTLNPGWKPASYIQHDNESFPIYSGKHKGEWNSCKDCHTNTSNYASFTCLTCHPKAEMDKEHKGRNNYSYDSAACLRCHPTGESDK